MMYTSVLKRDLSYSDALNTLMVGKEGSVLIRYIKGICWQMIG